MTQEPLSPILNRQPVTPSTFHSRWGWFVAFGVIVAALGVVALSTVIASTVVSIYVLGLLMVTAGAAEMAIGVRARAWGLKATWILVGLVYVLAGAFALAQPLVAAAVFTLMIGAALVATGVVRIVAGAQMHSGPKALVIGAGLVTTLLGGLIMAGWPASSLVVLGTFLGLDLVIYGMAWIGFGLRLRAASSRA